MIVLDSTHDLPVTSTKGQLASSSRDGGCYVDDTVPYTDQLDEAMSTDLESHCISSAASVASSSTEVPAPLPPSYEATVHTPQQIFKTFSKRTRRRWLIPVAIAVLYLVVSAAILIPWLAKRPRPRPPRRDHGPNWLPALNGAWPPLIPGEDPTSPSSVLPAPLQTNKPPFFSVADGNRVNALSEECKSWVADKKEKEDTPAGSVSYKFDMKDSFFITNKSKRGPPGRAPSAGSLLVRMNDDPKESQVVVDVTAKFTRDKCKKTAEVCIVKTKDKAALRFDVADDGKKDRWSPVLFDVILNLPHTPGLTVHNLTSHLSFFEHNFEDIGEMVSFEHVYIRGAYSPFGAKSLTVRDLTVWSTVKAISGKINVSRSLSLTTSLAPITVDVALTYDSHNEKPTTFALSTTNSPVTSTFTLYSKDSTDHGNKPRYSGMVTTANGPVNLSVMHSESVPEAELALMADTSLQPVWLYLDPRYEGGFEVKTKVATANVVGYEGVVDPSGLNRDRQISFDERGAWGTAGWVGWNARPTSVAGKSHIELSTELADATLVLTQTPPQ